MYVVVWVPTAIAAVTLMVGLVYLAERESCSDKAEVMGRDHRYGLFKGCMFEADSGEFVPEGQLRFNESGEVVE